MEAIQWWEQKYLTLTLKQATNVKCLFLNLKCRQCTIKLYLFTDLVDIHKSYKSPCPTGYLLWMAKWNLPSIIWIVLERGDCAVALTSKCEVLGKGVNEHSVFCMCVCVCVLGGKCSLLKHIMCLNGKQMDSFIPGNSCHERLWREGDRQRKRGEGKSTRKTFCVTSKRSDDPPSSLLSCAMSVFYIFFFLSFIIFYGLQSKWLHVDSKQTTLIFI